MFIWILIYHCFFTLVLKSPDGEWPITYTVYIHTTLTQSKHVLNLKLHVLSTTADCSTAYIITFETLFANCCKYQMPTTFRSSSRRACDSFCICPDAERMASCSCSCRASIAGDASTFSLGSSLVSWLESSSNLLKSCWKKKQWMDEATRIFSTWTC